MNEQIGIDFGTTTSAVCRCTYEMDRVQGVQEYVPFNGELYDRTAVLVTGTLTNGFGETVRSDEERYGWTAWEDTGKYPLLESGFKMELLSPDPRKREQAERLTKKYFGHLYQKYTENQVRKKDGKTEKTTTVVTYPAKFSSELQAFLKEAAEKAGFSNVLLINEAQAAMQYALHFDSGETAAFFRNNRKQVLKVMLIDMGAGTTDIAVFEYDTQEPSQVKTIAFYPKQGGYNFGGGEIDQKLYEFYVSKLGSDYPADYSNDGDAALGERLLKENIKQHKEQHLSRQLQEKQTASAPMDLMRDARRSPEKPDLRLDREGFEMLLMDSLPQFAALVNGALEEAKLVGEEIDLVLLTGGHSQWYFVREMLLNKDLEHQVKLKLTENQILTFPQPHLVVAKGAAVIDLEAKKFILAEGTISNFGTWSIDSSGLLTIDGRGEMPYWTSNSYCAPWSNVRDKIKSVYITNGATSIGSFAFHHCSNLSNVTIPNTVTCIHESAFSKCSALIGIDLPDSVSEIGSHAFADCSSLVQIALPDGITHIQACTFEGCSSLSSVTLPDSIISLDNFSFSYCSKLSKITLPCSITRIRDGAFRYCSNLSDIQIPAGTLLGKEVFHGCDKLKRYTSPDSSKRIVASGTIEHFGTWSLDSDGLLTIEGRGVLSQDIWLSMYNKVPPLGRKIHHIHIKEGVTGIGDCAFKCITARHIKLPETLTHIEGGAFMMSDIEEITIPNSVTSIKPWAFEGCRKLKKVVMPSRFNKSVIYRGLNIFSPIESWCGFETYHGISKKIVTFV